MYDIHPKTCFFKDATGNYLLGVSTKNLSSWMTPFLNIQT